MAVGEAFPTGPEFLLAKSSFPSLNTPTVLSQQELGNPVGKAFANRVGVFANSLALLAKHAFPVVHVGLRAINYCSKESSVVTREPIATSFALKISGSILTVSKKLSMCILYSKCTYPVIVTNYHIWTRPIATLSPY
jgi:hypothetical protein